MLYDVGTMNEAVKRAIDVKGNGAAFAAAIGRSPQFVSQLLLGHRPVPPELCLVIERETGVRRQDLLPNFPWDALRSPAARVKAKAV
jgi:DNA-binding transcriptional regulator YdaS (Cro superfamily)